MFKMTHQKIYLIAILLILLILFSFSYAGEVKKIQSDVLKSVEDVENAIRNNTLNERHYLQDFAQIAEASENPPAYKAYLNGVWFAKSRAFENATTEFYNALDLIEASPDTELEMLILEKLLEIDEVYGNVVDYQENAFRLRLISAGVDDQKYIKALYAIADAHFRIYNDKTARSYLTFIFEESEEIDYAYGFSRYHLLYGDMENTYKNFDDAKYHYRKAYEYGLKSEYLLSLCYESMIEIRIARTETYDGHYRLAYNRLVKLLDNIGQKSNHMQREIYFELGVTARYLGLYEEALDYLELALTSDYLVNKNYEVEVYSAEIYAEIASVYVALGDTEKAVQYFEWSSEVESYQDSEEIRGKQVSALNAYEISELQRELAFRQRLKEANENTIALQKRYLIMGASLTTALGISFFILVWLYFARGLVQKKLYKESITDDLTKVFNRGHIIDLLEENTDKTTCLLMMDVDNFKMINDTFGHTVGDKVLVKLAQVISNNMREEDCVGRYGGEEFLVILKNTDLEKGLLVAERIRQAADDLKWDEEIKTTLSIGLLQCDGNTADALLIEADILMYRAKRLGKNRVVF